MANQQAIESVISAIAEDFDILPFADSIFNTLNSFRSKSPAKPSAFFSEATDVEIGNISENRLNAFLRVIGFPATRNETELTDEKLTEFLGIVRDNANIDDSILADLRLALLSQQDTLNYFSPESFGEILLPAEESITPEFLGRRLSSRDSLLSRKISVPDYVKLLRDPLPIASSIYPDFAKGRRPNLFPLVVNADIPVFPYNRRTAPAFNGGDYIVRRERLSRPFIEHVIFTRQKFFSGLESPLKPFLQQNIFEGIFNSSENLTDDQEVLLDSLDDYNSIELQLLQKFLVALKLSAKKYFNAIRRAEELKGLIDFVPAPKEQPNEKVGEERLSSSEVKDTIKEANGSNENDAFIETSKVIDAEIESIKSEISRLDAFIQLTPTEALLKSDEINRIGELNQINNLISDVLVSEFTSLLLIERNGLQDLLDEANNKKTRTLNEYNNLKHLLAHFTGEFTGLSIFDVICILAALFTVEPRFLVGILNKSAQARLLESDSFYSTQASDGVDRERTLDDIADGASSVTLNESLIAIQDEVTRFFNITSSFLEEFRTQENKGN